MNTKQCFQIKNKLNLLIYGKQMGSMEDNKALKISEIEEELAKFCSVSRDMIISIKLERSNPSLAVALKISEYFNTSVNSIFYIKGDKENV